VCFGFGFGGKVLLPKTPEKRETRSDVKHALSARPDVKDCARDRRSKATDL
jgi:hypothetical protein